MNNCPDCEDKATVFCHDTGETICKSCGIVISSEESIDRGPEWRLFSLDEKDNKSRVGMPINSLRPDKNLYTTFDLRDVRNKSPDVKRKLWMMKRWQGQNKSGGKNFVVALNEIDKFSDKLHIPDHVQEEALNIYKKAYDLGIIKGRTISGMIAATLYAACRITGHPKSMKEVSSVSFIKRKDVARCYRLLIKELNIKMPVADPKLFVPKIATKLGLSEKTKQKAVAILRDKNSGGRDPLGLAATAIYIASLLNDEDVSQKKLAFTASITEVTIRNRCKTFQLNDEKDMEKLKLLRPLLFDSDRINREKQDEVIIEGFNNLRSDDLQILTPG